MPKNYKGTVADRLFIGKMTEFNLKKYGKCYTCYMRESVSQNDKRCKR